MQLFTALSRGLTVAVLAALARGAAAIEKFEPTLFSIRQNGKVGFIDADGKVKIAPAFESNMGGFNEGLAAVAVNVPLGFSGPDKKPVFGPRYGFIDESGAMVIAPQYVLAMYFREGLAWVETGSGAGYFIDKTGKPAVSPPNGTFCRDFREGLARAIPHLPRFADWPATDRKIGFIDKSGNYAIQPAFDRAWDFSEGLAAVKQNGKWGFINKTGAFAIEPQFESAHFFSQGIAAVEKGGQSFFIGKDGRRIIARDYAEIQSFNGDLAGVRVGDKWGFADKSGALIIAPQWDEVSTFFGERASVTRDGKRGVIDTNGTIIVEPTYDYIGFFGGGLASVTFHLEQSDGAGIGYIDRAGKIVWAPEPKTPEPKTPEPKTPEAKTVL